MQEQPDRNKFLDEMKDRYERVFSNEDGKRVLADIVICGRLNKTCFSSDALMMAYNEGKRDLAQNILDLATPQDKKTTKQIKAKQ